MYKKYILLSLAVLLLATGCSKKNENKIEAKSLEATYRENGVPVRVESITKDEFTKFQTYYSEIMPNKRTVLYAKMEDRISKINAKAGDYVSKGTKVIEFPEDNTRNGIQETQANYDFAFNNMNRMKELLNSGAISQQEYDGIETQYKQAKASLDYIDNILDVTAPYNGYITELPVSENDHVFIDDPLFAIADLSKLKSTIWVNENDIEFIKKNMEATATWKDYTISGKVTNVSLTMDSQRRAFRVEIVFDNTEMNFKTGVTAEINLQLYKKTSVINIPYTMIRSIESTPFVWIAEDNKAVKREITLGLTGKDKIEITSGLQEGELLISEGYHIVSENDKLKIMD